MIPNWLACYCHQIASATGWGFREIMEDLPLAAGLQIIDADLYTKGIPRVYGRTPAVDFDSLAAIDAALGNL